MSTYTDCDIQTADFSHRYSLWCVNCHELTIANRLANDTPQGSILYSHGDRLRVAATDSSVKALERYLGQSDGGLVIPSIYELPEMRFEGIHRIEPLRAPNRPDFLLRVREMSTMPAGVAYARGDRGEFFAFDIQAKPKHLKLLDLARTEYIQLSAGRRFLPQLEI